MLRYNLDNLKRKLDYVKGREYTWKEIGERTGVHVNVLTNISHNRTKRADFDNVEKLLAFFRSEGLDVSLGDIITEVDATGATGAGGGASPNV